MSAFTRLLVAFGCIFAVVLTIENSEIEDYIQKIFIGKSGTDSPNYISGFISNIAFATDKRAILYINGTEFFASLDGSDVIDVRHLYPNVSLERINEIENFAMGTVDGNNFALYGNGTDYKLMDEHTHQFDVIHHIGKGFEISEDVNGTHVEEAKVFIQRVNNVYSRLPY